MRASHSVSNRLNRKREEEEKNRKRRRKQTSTVDDLAVKCSIVHIFLPDYNLTCVRDDDHNSTVDGVSSATSDWRDGAQVSAAILYLSVCLESLPGTRSPFDLVLWGDVSARLSFYSVLFVYSYLCRAKLSNCPSY